MLSAHLSSIVPLLPLPRPLNLLAMSPTAKEDLAKAAESNVPEEEHNGDGHLESARLDDMEGLTLFEKKFVLINREIDDNGMGKYQWYIWALCGFGYLLDLLWAQAFGLVLSPLEQELGFPGKIDRIHAHPM